MRGDGVAGLPLRGRAGVSAAALLHVVVSGLATGSIYALVALSLSDTKGHGGLIHVFSLPGEGAGGRDPESSDAGVPRWRQRAAEIIKPFTVDVAKHAFSACTRAHPPLPLSSGASRGQPRVSDNLTTDPRPMPSACCAWRWPPRPGPSSGCATAYQIAAYGLISVAVVALLAVLYFSL
jgi:hypothetical protein